MKVTSKLASLETMGDVPGDLSPNCIVRPLRLACQPCLLFPATFIPCKGTGNGFSKGTSNLLYTDLPSIQAVPWGELPSTVPLASPHPTVGLCCSHPALDPAAELVCKLVLIELALFSHRGWWRQDVAT